MATEPVTSNRNRFVVSCVIALGVLLVLFVVVMVFENPAWAFYLFGTSKKFEILKFLGIGMGGVLLTLQVWMSHKRAKAMEDAATAQSEATKEQAKANRNIEQGQRQERLKNAVEHLGHRSVSVRLSGAYELFHLAQDTEDLRQTVHGILCAHIRETTTVGEYLERYQSEPSTEIQNLLTLLFVQEHEVFRHLKADLMRSCLKGANLRGARLRGAVLTEARLQFAILRGARLQGAFLRAARLQGAYLCDTQLQGAILHSGKLQGADMTKAGLQGASLGGAGLQAAALQGVQLQGVKDWTADDRTSLPTFAELITKSIGRESDLSGVTFESGIDQKGMDSLVNGLSGKNETWLRNKLAPHIDEPYRSPQLPEGSGAITGTYTKKDAEAWIAEYKTDM